VPWVEFLEKILERYIGAKSFRDLQTIAALSRLIILVIVGQFCLSIWASAGAP